MTSFADLAGSRLPLQLAGMGGDRRSWRSASRGRGCGRRGDARRGRVAAGCARRDARRVLVGGERPGRRQLPDAVPRPGRRAGGVDVRTPVVEFFYGDPDPDRSWRSSTTAERSPAGRSVRWTRRARPSRAGCGLRRRPGGRGRRARARHAAARRRARRGGRRGRRPDRRRRWDRHRGATSSRALEAGASAVRVGTRFVAAARVERAPRVRRRARRRRVPRTPCSPRPSRYGWPDAPHRVLRACVDAANAISRRRRSGDAHGRRRVPRPRGSAP